MKKNIFHTFDFASRRSRHLLPTLNRCLINTWTVPMLISIQPVFCQFIFILSFLFLLATLSKSSTLLKLASIKLYLPITNPSRSSNSLNRVSLYKLNTFAEQTYRCHLLIFSFVYIHKSFLYSYTSCFFSIQILDYSYTLSMQIKLYEHYNKFYVF